MLIRAMIGGGLSVGLLALARNPLDLVILRGFQGAASGTIAATTTLVATGTPREHVGRAMGVISSAVALGSAVGPFAGGIAANYIPLRWVFLGGGVLLLVAVVPVVVLLPPDVALAMMISRIRTATPIPMLRTLWPFFLTPPGGGANGAAAMSGATAETDASCSWSG